MTAFRPLQPADLPDAVRLLPDLGYEATGEQLARRLQALREWPDQEAFVAEDEGAVVALCHVQGVRLLVADGYAEVQALVVAAGRQGQGIGGALLAHACDWAFARGYERVRLRSGLHREGAHAFYVAQGFEQSRASYAFEKRR
jgi:GNAT superfamily N-acetyltransferase